jgi:hypothetical protein
MIQYQVIFLSRKGRLWKLILRCPASELLLSFGGACPDVGGIAFLCTLFAIQLLRVFHFSHDTVKP